MKNIFLSSPIKPDKIKKLQFENQNVETLEANTMKIRAKFTTRGSFERNPKKNKRKSIKNFENKFVKK